MKKAKKFKCAMNFFWVNHYDSPSVGVPLVESRIKLLEEYYFSKPSGLPFDLLIAVMEDGFKPGEHKGALRSYTPEELKIAFIRAIARDIRAKVAVDVVQQWQYHALTCTAAFNKLGSEAGNILYAIYYIRYTIYYIYYILYSNIALCATITLRFARRLQNMYIARPRTTCTSRL